MLEFKRGKYIHFVADKNKYLAIEQLAEDSRYIIGEVKEIVLPENSEIPKIIEKRLN